MQEIEGIVILGVALGVVTAISVARGISHRLALAAAAKKRAQLERLQGQPQYQPLRLPQLVERPSRRRAA